MWCNDLKKWLTLKDMHLTDDLRSKNNFANKFVRKFVDKLYRKFNLKKNVFEKVH